LNAPASRYDLFPSVAVTSDDADCIIGWPQIGAALGNAQRIVVELYPGCFEEEIAVALNEALRPELMLRTQDALLPADHLDEKFGAALGDDPVFAHMETWRIEDFFCAEKLRDMAAQAAAVRGRVLVIGTGAALVLPELEQLVYADLARWEIQRRQRAHRIANLGMHNADASPAALYKRAFFLDWRAADRLKTRLFDRIDFLLDTHRENEPKLISGEHLRQGLRTTVSRPFRVVPFFDPGPWGGQWMKEKFALPDGPPNYAWCFDCVPEENSLLLGFGEQRIEIPALDAVLYCPRELLGAEVYEKFGAEFPIRFDYLDTMAGGNLSLQVHPLREYIREKFGMDYTQDESYYMLDAGEDGVVYLGVKENIDREQMKHDLERAQRDATAPFDAERYVNIWPAKKHDHFLIPAGTIHCSGRNGVVLEISATPYIFTFKLWDWGRLGLDGKPRPIHLEHGLSNIQWDRSTDWVRKNLLSPVEQVNEGDGWREEKTGLHALEFIETRRHWFTGYVAHDTAGTVNVLNLVEGEAAIVESPSGAFQPFTIHYGETFIVPAQVGAYLIRPETPSAVPLATMKAFVRGSDR
jgi:mannose-6-phosphate isomerase class I